MALPPVATRGAVQQGTITHHNEYLQGDNKVIMIIIEKKNPTYLLCKRHICKSADHFFEGDQTSQHETLEQPLFKSLCPKSCTIH